MEKPDTSKLSKELVEYIEDFERVINSRPKLINELNRYCNAIADEVIEFRESGNIFICEDGEIKVTDRIKFDNIMKYVAAIPKMRALNYKEPAAKKPIKEPVVTKPKNIQDLIITNN